MFGPKKNKNDWLGLLGDTVGDERSTSPQDKQSLSELKETYNENLKELDTIVECWKKIKTRNAKLYKDALEKLENFNHDDISMNNLHAYTRQLGAVDSYATINNQSEREFLTAFKLKSAYQNTLKYLEKTYQTLETDDPLSENDPVN